MKVYMFDNYVNNRALNEAILYHEAINDGELPYLVMSTSTAVQMIKELNRYLNISDLKIPITKESKVQYPEGRLGIYMGCKVFCDEDLELGVIDIR